MAAPHLEYAHRTANPDQVLSVYEDLEPFLSRSPSSPDAEKTQALLAVLGNSNFLARWAQRHPEEVVNLLRQDLNKPMRFEDFKREWNQDNTNLKGLDRQPLAVKLSHFKYRHFFRITLRDLGLHRPFSEIVAELTDLSKWIVQVALDWHWNNFQETVGRSKIPFTVMAMGKMGGRELNFSSDIDLIYFYGSDEEKIQPLQPNGPCTPHEYFVKLSERLTQFLSQRTGDGFLYRVDLDLRPEGQSGAIANSIDAMEDYYQHFGAAWERQAMIKAACGAGDPALFQNFLARIHPFIYPKTTDFSFLADLKKMKEKIIQSIQNLQQKTYHLKLGEGGIREIEFFVQIFQLLFGGQKPSLQTPNTLEALERLQQNHLIRQEEKEGLEKAYLFLRTMEHRLQLAEEQQIHQLPAQEEELNHLARRMGYPQKNVEEAREAMLCDLEKHRKFVNTLFNDLLSHRFFE